MGIILCTGKKSEQIELLEMDRSGIHVAEYLTALPSRKVLGEKLHLAAERARRQLEHRVPRSETSAPIVHDHLKVAGRAKPSAKSGRAKASAKKCRRAK